MIDLSESEVKSGAPVETWPQTWQTQPSQGYDLSSPLSSLLSLLSRHSVMLTAAAAGTDQRPPPPPPSGHHGLFAAFRNISVQRERREGTGPAVTIQLISLSWSHTAQLNTINPARSRALIQPAGPRYCVSIQYWQGWNNSQIISPRLLDLTRNNTPTAASLKHPPISYSSVFQPCLYCRPTSVLSNSVSNTIKWW